MRRIMAALATALFALPLAVGTVAAGGPPSFGFYVHDEPYRTLGTPTDFDGTGAPQHSFDTIYALGPGLINVAEAAPGDTDFNGGRWMVVPVIWDDSVPFEERQLTDADDLAPLVEAGLVSFAEPTKYFLCPVIKALPSQ